MGHAILGQGGESRVLNILDANALKREAREQRGKPESHYPSNASAWLGCPTCDEARACGAEPTGPCSECAAFGRPGMVLRGACMRAMLFALLNIPRSNPRDAGEILKMRSGNVIADMISDGLEGIPRWQEFPVKLAVDGLRLPVSGRLDAQHLHEDSTIGFEEIKANKSQAINYQVRDGVRWSTKLQVACYNSMLKRLNLPITISDIHVLLFAPDNGYRHEIEEEVNHAEDELIWLACVERWKELEGFVESGALPAAEYRHVDAKGRLTTDSWLHWLCRYGPEEKKKDGYCGWRCLCHALEYGEVAWPLAEKEAPNAAPQE